jgi:hypothetical protein
MRDAGEKGAKKVEAESQRSGNGGSIDYGLRYEHGLKTLVNGHIRADKTSGGEEDRVTAKHNKLAKYFHHG